MISDLHNAKKLGGTRFITRSSDKKLHIATMRFGACERNFLPRKSGAIQTGSGIQGLAISNLLADGFSINLHINNLQQQFAANLLASDIFVKVAGSINAV